MAALDCCKVSLTSSLSLSRSVERGGRDFSRKERYGSSETSDIGSPRQIFRNLSYFSTMHVTTNNVEDANNRPTTSKSLKVTETEMEVMEADIAKLTSLLSQDSEDDADISKLLGRLDNVNGMAQGVEHKLDGLLEKLDGLLASLETKEEVEKTSDLGEANSSVR